MTSWIISDLEWPEAGPSTEGTASGCRRVNVEITVTARAMLMDGAVNWSCAASFSFSRI